jgi:hypothetical protein
MLRVSIDAFSGVPNPSVIVTGTEASELLKEIGRNRGVVTDAHAGPTGLGLRGLIVEVLSDDAGQALDLPGTFKVGAGTGPADSKGLELVERVIRSLRKYTPVSPFTDTPRPIDQGLEDYLLRLLSQTAPQGTTTERDGAPPPPPPPTDATCMIERAKFNPGFWNAPDVIGRNNCYNYASNWRTNTFAQPGKGAGHMYTALTCAEVSRAALADGCHRRYDCFPDTEKSRWLMALVIAPGQDYHWYRLHTKEEGFWGHKPGATAARNTDNSGRIVTNPETCDRGPYTEFCGYFYSCKSQQQRIR